MPTRQTQTFKEESDEWLKPFGYSIHAISGDGKTLYYSCWEKAGENYPAIRIEESFGDSRKVTLTNSGCFKLFLRMEAQELSYKHPDIKQYIDTLKYYADLAERFPPPKL